jgi:hypothetical protein
MLWSACGEVQAVVEQTQRVQGIRRLSSAVNRKSLRSSQVEAAPDVSCVPISAVPARRSRPSIYYGTLLRLTILLGTTRPHVDNEDELESQMKVV